MISTQTINHYIASVTLKNQFPDSIEYISKIGESMISRLKFTVVNEASYKFQPIGVTYTYILSQSHFTIHTWPEFKKIYFDVFSCSELSESEVVRAINESCVGNEITKLEMRKIDLELS